MYNALSKNDQQKEHKKENRKRKLQFSGNTLEIVIGIVKKRQRHTQENRYIQRLGALHLISNGQTHTHSHAHLNRERERERAKKTHQN